MRQGVEPQPISRCDVISQNYPNHEAHMRLKGKVAIVTGGGTGIGEAVTFKFVREGASVVVAGRSSTVDEVANRIKRDGGKAVAFRGDLAEEKNAEACVQTAIDEFGRLDILINNAGVLDAAATVDAFPVEKFDGMLRNNLRTAFLMTRFAIPHLQKTRGSIISAGSEAGLNGTPMATPYGGTKAFLHAFMKGVALEHSLDGNRNKKLHRAA
jgi:NAD(P)-dependent dehydrogenase (short-subunit alcohol dehydrogenase family)